MSTQQLLDQASLSAFVQWLRTLRQHYGPTVAHLRAADHDDSHHPPVCRVARTAYLKAELAAMEHRLAMMGVRPAETRLPVVGGTATGRANRRALPPLMLGLWLPWLLWALAVLSAAPGMPAHGSPLHAASGRQCTPPQCDPAFFAPGYYAAQHATPWHRPRWAHPDHTCRDTRALLLASRCAAVTWSPNGCHVRTATCLDVYTGAQVSTDDAPHALQVDHLLPVAVARARRAWTPAQFTQYYNDTDNLMVTRARTNEQKGDRMPGSWCPALPGARRLAAVRLSRVAAYYRIPLTGSDRRGLGAWSNGHCAAGAKVLGDR